jgi:hypothetical protein
MLNSGTSRPPRPRPGRDGAVCRQTSLTCTNKPKITNAAVSVSQARQRTAITLTISIAGVTEPGHPARSALCRRHEVSRWRRADRGGACPPGAGAAGRSGDDRGRRWRPGGGEAFPGVADVGQTGGGGRWPRAAGWRWPPRARAARSASSARLSRASWRRCWTQARSPAGLRISAGRWPGSPSRSGSGLGWSTRRPGWMCCCTGSAGACRSRPAAPPSGTRIRSPGGGRRPGPS